MTSQNQTDEEAFADFHTEKWVGLYGEICTDGLWDREGSGISVEFLPVSGDLRARIRDWGSAYEWYGKEPTETELAFIRSYTEYGLMLARELKTALPDWTVFYLSDSSHHLTPTGKRDGEILGDGSFGDLREPRR